MENKEATIVDGMKAAMVEVRSQRDIALAAPRDEKKVYEKVIAELNAFPEFASKAFYVIPFKKPDGKTKNVEGNSIKAAMALCRCWGNCANGARVVDQNDERILVEGVFVDYETNMRTMRTIAVDRYYIKKSTQQQTPLRADALLRAVQSGMSKAVRNAILASLPAPLTEGYFKEAQRIAGSGRVRGQKKAQWTPQEKLKELRKLLEKAGVTKDRLDAYIVDTLDGKDDASIAGVLTGVYNAIKDGQSNVDDFFGKQENTGTKEKGKATLADAFGKGKKDTKKQEELL